MKYIKITILVQVLSNICCFMCKADGQDLEPRFSVTFKYDARDIPDSIGIFTLTEANEWGELTSFFVKANKDQKFRFRLPKITKPTLFHFASYTSGRATTVQKYFAEPGDKIGIYFYEKKEGDSIIFSGDGAEKYNLTEQIIRKYNEFDSFRRTLSSGRDSLSFEVYLKKLGSIIEKCSEEKLKLINNYPKINMNVKALLNCQFGNYYGSWLGLLEYFYKSHSYHSNSVQSKKIITKHFNLKNNQLQEKPGSLSVLSPAHIIILAFGIKMDVLLNNENGNVDLQTYYKHLKYSYSGIIRERLLTEFFISGLTMEHIIGYSPNVFDSLLVDALESVTNAYYRKLLVEKTKTKEGSKIYYAEFEDLNGNSFSTKSLRGKVFLVDLWVLGCAGCAQFHEKFEKEIYPAFKGKNDFAVLSINANQTKERWIEGLNSNQYSSKCYINVWTGAVGLNHPFFNYYTNALPLLLIVNKEGNIITKIRGTENPSELISIINFELDKKESK